MPNLQDDKNPPNATVSVGSSEMTHPSGTAESLSQQEQQLVEVEELTFKLKKLMVKYEDTLAEEGIRKQIETLERWTESYRRGLKAAKNISDTGLTWLGELRNHLKLSADEILRFEEEGGNPITPEQAAKADALLKATRSLDKVIPIMENIFTPDENREEPK